jgi:hypothetical protein
MVVICFSQESKILLLPMGRPSKCKKPLGLYIASTKPFTHTSLTRILNVKNHSIVKCLGHSKWMWLSKESSNEKFGVHQNLMYK